MSTVLIIQLSDLVCSDNWIIDRFSKINRVHHNSSMKSIGHCGRELCSCAMDNYLCDPPRLRTSCEEREERENVVMNVGLMGEIERNMVSTSKRVLCSMATRRKSQIKGATQRKKIT